MMRSEYGPQVWCDQTGLPETTHRPAGSEDPWFCMTCGSTDHPLIDPKPELVLNADGSWTRLSDGARGTLMEVTR